MLEIEDKKWNEQWAQNIRQNKLKEKETDYSFIKITSSVNTL